MFDIEAFLSQKNVFEDKYLVQVPINLFCFLCFIIQSEEKIH